MVVQEAKLEIASKGYSNYNSNLKLNLISLVKYL